MRPAMLQYLLTVLLLGLITGLLIGLAEPVRPWLAYAAMVPFGVAVIHPPRRPKQREPWGQ